MKRNLKIISLILTLSLCFSAGVWAEETEMLGNVIPSEDNPMSYEDVIANWDEITADMTEEELIFFTEQRDAWADTLANWGDLEAEAAEFQQSQPQTRGGVGNSFMFLDGDILVTSSSITTKLIGHSAMVCGDRVIEMGVSGINRTLTIQQWLNDRDDVVALRRFAPARTIPVNAASYGLSYFINGPGSNYKYDVKANRDDMNSANCASLIYQCYKNGGNFTIYAPQHLGLNYLMPYDFIDERHKGNNEFEVIYLKGNYFNDEAQTKPKQYKNFDFSNVVYDWADRNMSGHLYKYYPEQGVFNTSSLNGGAISPNREVNVFLNLTETNERIALQNVVGQGRADIWYFPYKSTTAIGQKTYMGVSTKYRYNDATRVRGTWSPDCR